MNKILFLLLLSITFIFSSCTYIAVQYTKYAEEQLKQLNDSAVFYTPNKERQNAMVDASTLTSSNTNTTTIVLPQLIPTKNFATPQTITIQKQKVTANIITKSGENYDPHNFYTRNDTFYLQNGAVQPNHDGTFIYCDTCISDIEKGLEIKQNLKINVLSVNSDNYPNEIKINVNVMADNRPVSGLASPHLPEGVPQEKYWLSILDSCKSKNAVIKNFKVEEIRTETSPFYNICYVLDHSGSMGDERCLALQNAVRYSLKKVKQGDHLSVIKFTNLPYVEVYPTQSKDTFVTKFKLNGMKIDTSIGGGTDILKAIDKACDVLTGVDTAYQRIIILFTDGESSMYDYNRVIKKARRNKIKIYTVAYGMVDFINLKNIARDSYGHFYYLREVRDFADAFSDIYDILSNFYQITYTPPECSDLHNVTINNLLDTAFTSYDKSFFASDDNVGEIMLANIEFEYNSYAISKNSNALILDIAQQLKNNANIKIEISGHTDSIGNSDYNLKLSKERADAVKTALEKLGIKGDRITTIGYGSQRPLVSNDTEENRKKNRRTEFKVLE